jgi:predicted HTH transcriptional regulator
MLGMSVSLISDAEILARLAAGEDSFVERKSLGDWKKDATKTCVAFANSCPFEGPPGLFCIGVKDDGTIENSQQDLDTVQKTFERELEEAYPPIFHHTRIVSASEGRFVAVIVPGSSQGPHFCTYLMIGAGFRSFSSRVQIEGIKHTIPEDCARRLPMDVLS